jgi:hypothetical protein
MRLQHHLASKRSNDDRNIIQYYTIILVILTLYLVHRFYINYTLRRENNTITQIFTIPGYFVPRGRKG